MRGGHYISYVSRIIDGQKKWFYISDASVKEVSEEIVLKAEAYMLFYFKINSDF
jgi:ubiquitin C-terminal hydrolase